LNPDGATGIFIDFMANGLGGQALVAAEARWFSQPVIRITKRSNGYDLARRAAIQ